MSHSSERNMSRSRPGLSNGDGPLFLSKFTTHLASRLVGEKKLLKCMMGGVSDFECYWRTPLLQHCDEGDIGISDGGKQAARVLFVDVAIKGLAREDSKNPSVDMMFGALLETNESGDFDGASAHSYWKSKEPMSQEALERHFEQSGFDLLSSPPDVTARSFADALRGLGNDTTAAMEDTPAPPTVRQIRLSLKYKDFGQSSPLVIEDCTKSPLNRVALEMILANLQEHDELTAQQGGTACSTPDRPISEEEEQSSHGVTMALQTWWENVAQASRTRQADEQETAIEFTASDRASGRIESTKHSTCTKSGALSSRRPIRPNLVKRPRPMAKNVPVRPNSKKNKKSKMTMYASDSSDSRS